MKLLSVLSKRVAITATCFVLFKNQTAAFTATSSKAKITGSPERRGGTTRKLCNNFVVSTRRRQEEINNRKYDCNNRSYDTVIKLQLKQEQEESTRSVAEYEERSGESSTFTDEFDSLLDDLQLRAAIKYLQRHSNKINITKERWVKIFQVIEQRTIEADESQEKVNIRVMEDPEYPLVSQSRTEMSDMYTILADLNYLRVFGSIDSKLPPAAGSHTVRPEMLEQITSLSMVSLTPQATNNIVYAGLAAAIIEILISIVTGISINFLIFLTIAFLLFDRILLSGASSESFERLFSPGIQSRIEKHEAGHFLCAYLLGCPVEGCVLTVWDALMDARFGIGRQVTAGTSFFDPILSNQVNTRGAKTITRSSVDRYSIIVMAGIAAEAMNFGRTDGGAGDEGALIGFLSTLNGGRSPPPWDSVTIRNQARWGALQAVLILREYQPCYDALVSAFEQKKVLGECIYDIEKAAKEYNLGPLNKPIGYIVEKDGCDFEEWKTTDLP